MVALIKYVIRSSIRKLCLAQFGIFSTSFFPASKIRFTVNRIFRGTKLPDLP